MRVEPKENPVVIIISSDAEWKTVLAILAPPKIYTTPYGSCFILAMESSEDSEKEFVVFVQGGWGKIAAAGSTQYVIDRWNPRLLANFGTCGGFYPHTTVGDLLLIEQAVVYDMHVLIGSQEEEERFYTTPCSAELIEWAAGIADVRRATIASADRDVEGERIPAVHERFNAIAGDWESASIAFVAGKNSVPCIIVRGVSDVVGGPTAGDTAAIFEDYLAGVQTVIQRILDAFLVPLSRWEQEKNG